MLALIAGTGFYDWEALQNQQEKHVQTPYGEAVLFVGEVATPDGSKPLVFLPRHARSHSIPPHLINYRANIWALHSLGVQKIVAVNAVGSLLREVPPGSTAVGVPARIVRVDGCPVYYADDVDQISVQDPVREELERLARQVEELERTLADGEKARRRQPA